MKNLGSMMKQAQQLQTRMAEAKEALADARIEGESGGGLVRVTVDGKGDIKAVRIDAALVDPNEVSVLEDLIVAAYGAAREKADEQTSEMMKEITGGLPLPLPPSFKPF